MGREAFLLPSLWPMGPSFITICHKAEEVCCCTPLNERWHKGKSNEHEQDGIRLSYQKTKQQQATGKLAAVFLLKIMWQLQAKKYREGFQ